MIRKYLLVGATACLWALAAAAAEPEIPLYTAVYTVEYKGRDTGVSEFSVGRDAAREVFTFSSETQVKGLLRLMSPRPVLERSEFQVVDGQLRPLEFRYEDGSRKGEDNFTARFDWSSSQIVINGGAAFALTPGVLDRGSMQVAVMLDAAAGRIPGPYMLADEDGLKTYEYSLEDPAEIDTPLGHFTAQRYRQQRQGSSRTTLLWTVPELKHLPVLIQQFRDGEVHTAFTIESLSWQ